MGSIEEKEIRGINLKILRTLVVGIISVVLSVAYSYFGLRYSIQEMRIEKVARDQVVEIKFQTMQVQINELKMKP